MSADDDATLSAFDEFFERALSLDVLTEAEVDALTDAVASGAISEEGAIERHRAALDTALDDVTRAADQLTDQPPLDRLP